MLLSLMTTAFLMGLAGLPHCAAMCATPCAMAVPQGLPLRALLGRSMGYAALGAVAAGATAILSRWARASAVLQPFWVMLLAASAFLGLWMMWRGEVPQALQNHGLAAYGSLQQGVIRHERLAGVRWFARWLPLLLGAAWAALPCGLLYGVVTIAALAPSAWQGAVVMLAFSLPGAVALWWWPRQLRVWSRARSSGPATAAEAVVDALPVVPVLWMRHVGGGAQPMLPKSPPAAQAWRSLVDPRWASRLSGLCLAAASSWALWHRLLDQWRAWCA